MRHNLLVAIVLIAPLFAQKKWTPPRTADGHPDVQGIWTNATITPFERPASLAGKEFFTEQEAAAYEKQTLANNNRDKRGATPEADVNGAYNDFWFDRGTRVVPTRRTSLVIDPPDGKVPALTPEARKADAARQEIARRPPQGPEDTPLAVRCLVWPTSGPALIPSAYNNNYQIVQIPGYVVIWVEMIHDVRVIPLDGRPHLPAHMRRWLGDSRGHWEGDTLVVDTTNFSDEVHLRGSDRNLHLIERFRRRDADTIIYQFTVDDPSAFTKPWTGEVPMVKTPGPLYEYACHEGNYSMETMLKGARAQEREVAAKGSR
jgi:hypothetical protein